MLISGAMGNPEPGNETRTSPPDPEVLRPAPRFYLVIVREGSSSVFDLPETGALVIGRAAECDLRIDDRSMSRRHVRLVVAHHDVQVTDLGSRNGTRVNSVELTGARSLLPGDAITLGQVTLILLSHGHTAGERRTLTGEELRSRLQVEAERSLSRQSPLAVVALAPGQPVPQAELLRLAVAALSPSDHAGWFGATHLLAVLPGRGAEEARGAARRLLESALRDDERARAGFAVCPSDGIDVETLLASARAAADAARPREALAASSIAAKLTIGNKVAVVADPAMHRLYELVRRLAASDLPVLVAGETGTGKELVAQAVHAWSPRADKPFVALNCAAIQDTLVESELFGYERGAFSGALASKPGLLETARGGTVLLDEIGDLAASGQAKLLRALETGRITRVGDVRERPIDIRLVAASNRDLDADVAHGRFRQDLLFRLGAARVVLPPLRDRPREIPLLAQTFLDEATSHAGRKPMSFSIGALHALLARPWKGNVRELRNLARLLAATVQEDVVQTWHLREPAAPDAARPDPPPSPEDSAPEPTPPAAFKPVGEEIRDLERRRMLEALEASGGQQKKAAHLLGMPLRTFTLKMKKYGLHRKRPPE